MAEKKFTVEHGTIKFRRVQDTSWDAHYLKHGLLHVFDTWEEAHAFHVDALKVDEARAIAAAKRATNRLKKARLAKPKEGWV